MMVLILLFLTLSRFKRVFDQAVKQEEIFENIAKPVADRYSESSFMANACVYCKCLKYNN